MNFESGMERLTESASRALGMIISKYKTTKYMGFDTYEKLYQTNVIPVMDYGSEVWGYEKFNKSEIVQNRASRVYLGVHRFAPVLGLQGDLRWLSCRTRRKLNMVRYWNRLVNMDNTRITKRVFQWDYESNVNNWSSEINKILEEHSFDREFENQALINSDVLLQRALTLEQSDWRRKCQQHQN